MPILQIVFRLFFDALEVCYIPLPRRSELHNKKIKKRNSIVDVMFKIWSSVRIM